MINNPIINKLFKDFTNHRKKTGRAVVYKNRIGYKKQKNFCSKLYKKEQKKYLNFELRNFKDNKKFWRTVKPLISDKGVHSSRITIVDKKDDKTEKKKKIGDSNNEIISNNLDIANTFNEYFQNPITNPGITEYSDNFGRNTATLGDPVNIMLEKFKDYPSVRIMRVRKQESRNFW